MKGENTMKIELTYHKDNYDNHANQCSSNNDEYWHTNRIRILSLLSEYNPSEYVFEVNDETIDRALATDGLRRDRARRHNTAFLI